MTGSSEPGLDPDDDPNGEFQQLRAHLLAGGTLAGWQGLDEVTLEGIYTLASYFYEQSNYDEASRLFSGLCALSPNERRYIFGLGATRKMQGRFEEAAELLGLAVALDVEDPVPSFYVAECLLKMGQSSEALGMLEVCLANATAPEHAALRESADGLRALLTSGSHAGGASATPADTR